MNREKLKQELIRDEEIRKEAYQDSVGLWTIGVGHLLGDEHRILRLTLTEIEAFLESDIDIAEKIVIQLFPLMNSGDLTSEYEVRYRAFVNMAFNLGNKLKDFKKFIAAVTRDDWTTAAKEMMNSKWATQVGKRAERLRDMILYGKDV